MQSLTGLNPNTYTVITTDANGCTGTASITIVQPTILEASASVDANAQCNGGNDGSATILVTGGTPPMPIAGAMGIQQVRLQI